MNSHSITITTTYYTTDPLSDDPAQAMRCILDTLMDVEQLEAAPLNTGGRHTIIVVPERLSAINLLCSGVCPRDYDMTYTRQGGTHRAPSQAAHPIIAEVRGVPYTHSALQEDMATIAVTFRHAYPQTEG